MDRKNEASMFLFVIQQAQKNAFQQTAHAKLYNIIPKVTAAFILTNLIEVLSSGQ